jgi:cytochrome b
MKRSASAMTDERAPSPRQSGGAAVGKGLGRVVRVWDAPTRWVHALIIVLIGLAWWTESHDEMEWHIRVGCTLLGVVVFRLLWGVVGGPTARFSSFVRGPRTVLSYGLKLVRGGGSESVVGHNPMGGWSVVALLAVMAAEIAVGLFCVDVDGLESGPLADRVSFHVGRAAAHWHTLLFNTLLALIGLHLCAIAFYALVRRDNLIGPILTGRKRLSDSAVEGTTTGASTGSAAKVLVSGLFAVAAAVWAAFGFKI